MWINAHSELPESTGWYFACSNDMGTPTALRVSYWDTVLGKWLDTDEEEDTGIDYWMPVPAIGPRESREDKLCKLIMDRVRSAEEMTEGLRELLLTYLEKREERNFEEMKDMRQISFMIEDGRRYGVIEGRKQVIDNPEMYGLQKPLEWSEDDYDYYDTIVRKLEVIGDDSGLSKTQIKFLRGLMPLCGRKNNASRKPVRELLESLRCVLEREAEREGPSKDLENANLLYDKITKNFYE